MNQWMIQWMNALGLIKHEKKISNKWSATKTTFKSWTKDSWKPKYKLPLAHLKIEYKVDNYPYYNYREEKNNNKRIWFLFLPYPNPPLLVSLPNLTWPHPSPALPQRQNTGKTWPVLEDESNGTYIIIIISVSECSASSTDKN